MTRTALTSGSLSGIGSAIAKSKTNMGYSVTANYCGNGYKFDTSRLDTTIPGALLPRTEKVSNLSTIEMFDVFTNLTDIQIAGEKRQRALEACLTSERATAELREQFIAVLGHDLRNPLAAVSASAELLMLRKSDPDLLMMGRRLTKTTLRMAQLIDDVMDFARGRLGSGVGASITAIEDLATPLQEVVTELRTANCHCTIFDDITIESPVFCDHARVQQLLSNLLGNAIAHGSPDQPIIVRAFIEDDLLTLVVRNGGKVIPPESISKVFEPYWRVEMSKPGDGLGLGLFI
ncbi:ATP-binding protein [Caballeronia sp. LjRoot34]|uniref:sensor histidine kinase n=1 Tax=Caballeronia sp. LjRoot34 TaxID=3342325 RepID=UPI003ECC3D0E